MSTNVYGEKVRACLLCTCPTMYLVLATYQPSTHRAKVAFLFAFRNFYQRCLLLPAAAGLLLSLSQRCFTRGPALVQPLYGLAISLWGSVVLRAWRRQRSWWSWLYWRPW